MLRSVLNGGRVLCIGSAFALFGGACTDPSHPVEETDAYTASIVGTDAVFGVTVTGADVVLYVCGGPSNFARSRWYTGELTAEGNAELVASDGSHAAVSFEGTLVTGTVFEAEGTILEVEATRSLGESAGLYSVVDEGCRTGVVVIEGDGASEPMVQGTWCTDKGIYEQVTPIQPIADVEDAIEVEVTAVDLGDEVRRLVARRVHPREL